MVKIECSIKERHLFYWVVNGNVILVKPISSELAFPLI